MQKTKIVELLQKFSEKEISLFIEFCYSPYFNKNERLSKLAVVLKKHHPDFPAEKIERHKIYASLFPKEKYRDQRMRDLASGLLKLVSEFLAVNRFRSSQGEIYKNLLREYNSRGTQKMFVAALGDAKKWMNQNRENNTEFYYDMFCIGLEELEFINAHQLMTIRRGVKFIKSQSENLNYLTAYFLRHAYHSVGGDWEHHLLLAGVKPSNFPIDKCMPLKKHIEAFSPEINIRASLITPKIYNC